MKKVSLFVDVQNIYYTTKSVYQRNFDYNKFWTQATLDRQVVTARAYATSRGDRRQTEFQNILRAIGFDVKLKPFIRRSIVEEQLPQSPHKILWSPLRNRNKIAV